MVSAVTPGTCASEADGDSAASRTISRESVESLRAMCMSLLLVLALDALVRARWTGQGAAGLGMAAPVPGVYTSDAWAPDRDRRPLGRGVLRRCFGSVSSGPLGRRRGCRRREH